MNQSVIPFNDHELACIRSGDSKDLLRIQERREVVHAIASRNKIQDKLPTWYQQPAIQYPETISLEQSSSELTAAYKSHLISGKHLLDLTAGFGVDDFYFAKQFETLTSIEQQSELHQLASYNVELLGVQNIHCICSEASAFLETDAKQYDAIYIDPARRAASGRKTVLFDDCTPDVLRLLPILWQKTNTILIKSSPMIDISMSVTQLQHVSEVHIVSVQNECKELLFLLQQNYTGDYVVKAVDLLDMNRSMSFTSKEEDEAQVTYGDPQRYVYEPNAAIGKSGAFKLLSTRFNLNKLHPNTHLYTSSEYLDSFPGRCFDIQHTCKPQLKSLKAILPHLQANLILRNFPGSTQDLQKQLKLKNGGEDYVIACTLQNHQRTLLHGTRIY